MDKIKALEEIEKQITADIEAFKKADREAKDGKTADFGFLINARGGIRTAISALKIHDERQKPAAQPSAK